MRRGGHIHAAARRGFTLMESLIAAGLLLVIVVAVTSAVTAGQRHAYEAQQRISGTLAAEELMGRVLLTDYHDLADWHGYREAVGDMVDAAGDPLPSTFTAIGRSVEVEQNIRVYPLAGVQLLGSIVRTSSFDADGRILADLRRFVPYPSDALNSGG